MTFIQILSGAQRIFDMWGIKGTASERYVPHKWLSLLDVSLGTLRLFDPYIIFYYTFLSLADQNLSQDIISEVVKSRQVSFVSEESMKVIQQQLRDKFFTFTKEGKDRKVIITVLFLSQDTFWTLSMCTCPFCLGYQQFGPNSTDWQLINNYINGRERCTERS